jgi:hypothetical protein
MKAKKRAAALFLLGNVDLRGRDLNPRPLGYEPNGTFHVEHFCAVFHSAP